jgi:hypothetical protein
MDLPRPSNKDLDLAHRLYIEREPRDLFYRAALQLVALADRGEGDVTLSEALTVLLAVWNVQYYRMRPDARRTLVDDLDLLLAQHGAQLSTYRLRSLDSLSAEDAIGIRSLFSEFRGVLGPVGAAKALHLLAPRFFPIWDAAIRQAYRVGSTRPEGDADKYSAFMAIVKEQCDAFGGASALGRNPVKALDEYNFCRYTLGAPELLTE